MKRFKFISKKTVFTLLLAAGFAAGMAFAESVTVSEAKYDSSIHSGEYFPKGIKQGQFSDKRISSYKETKNSEGDSTTTIECNITGLSVFVDGEKIGEAPAKAVLTEGDHQVKVLGDDNYKTREVTIRVNSSKNSWFFIEVEAKSGKVTFKTSPEDAVIVINKKTYSGKEIFLEEGRKDYTIKAFGYKQIDEEVTVYGGKSRTVTAVMDKASFELQDFKVEGRSSFNPKAGGKYSRVECIATVPAAGSGTFQIKDADGNLVYEEKKDFTTWETSFIWDGKNSSGLYVANGTYTASMTAASQTKTLAVTIDSDLAFQRTWITPEGSGLGNVASAAFYPAKTWGGQITFSGIYDVNNQSWNCQANAAGLYTLGKHFELSTGLSFLFGDPFSVLWAMNIKGGSKVKLANSALYWALYGRYGIATSPVFYPYGADAGAGLGGGLAMGWEKNGLYLGADAGAYYNGLVGTFTAEEDPIVIKAGAMVNYTKSFFAAGAYISATSCVGDLSYTKDDKVFTGKTDFSNGLIRSLQAGLALKFFPTNTAVNVDVGGNVIYYPNESSLRASWTFGISAFY